MRYGWLAWTRGSANSEKDAQWAVRGGQRFQSKFWHSEAARRFVLTQIVEEVSEIRVKSPTLGRQSLFMAGAVAAFSENMALTKL